MDGWMIGAAGALFVVGGFFLFRGISRHLQAQSRAFQESLQGMQQSIVLFQQEFDRSQEVKANALRTEVASALQGNRQELQNALQANRTELQQGLGRTTEALEGKFQGLDARLDSRLKDLTGNVQTSLTANLKQGFEQFEKIQHHLKLAETQLRDLNSVGNSIHDLNNLLRLPHLRGGFGEATLERLLADLLPQGGYELQYRIVPNSTERVDAVVKYPNQVLPIDSKFPREQVLPLFEATDPETMERARKTLTDVMRALAKSIRDKYIHPEHGTTDMALLFVPSETLYFEILRNLKLCEELGKFKVFAASPNTLAVTLHAISISRSYYEMAKGVERTIEDVRKAQQHFDNFEKRFDEVGNQLGRAQTAFHTAETHLARYHSAVQRLTGSEALASAGPNPQLQPPQPT